jgi:hypothetical protein
VLYVQESGETVDHILIYCLLWMLVLSLCGVKLIVPKMVVDLLTLLAKEVWSE